MTYFKAILFSLFLTTFLLSEAQKSKLIFFKTEFEKEAFTDPQHQKPIDLLLAISNSGADKIQWVTSEIEELHTFLLSKKFQSKTEEKQVKMLFDAAHELFFTKYKEVANFDEIFESKTYNCVSATALYCLLLEKLGIPYAIKETPTHVYSIAYPNAKNIVIESTAPQSGYYSPGSADIQKAVSSLVDMKYYTREEVQTKGVSQVYREFFYGNDQITLTQLAGLQYYNEAVSLMTEEKFKDALSTALKSQKLYASDRIEFLILILLANVLSQSDYNELQDIDYLIAFANLPNTDETDISPIFRGIVSERLFAESKTELVDSIYDALTTHVTDSLILREISENYYEGLAKYYGQKSNIKKSLEYAEKSYLLNPNNVDIQAIIAQFLIQDFSRRRGSTSSLQKMDESMEKYPFLTEHSLFQSLYFYSNAYLAYSQFQADARSKGLQYIDKLEELQADQGDNLQMDESLYGMVYAEAGASYFRDRQYQKALNIIKKGLSIFPDHPELLARLEIVQDEIAK